MKVLVFDTETTGLIKKNDTKNNPYVVQISFILYDTDRHKILTEHDYIISVPIPIPEESTAIHKITTRKSHVEGIDMNVALDLFEICYDRCDMLIAHNIEFDKQMLLIECKRQNSFTLIDKLINKTITEFCTMKNAIQICKIERKFKNGDTYYKYPTLNELHEKMFGISLNNLHNSFNDIVVCLRCYMIMTVDIDIVKHSKNIHKYFKSLI